MSGSYLGDALRFPFVYGEGIVEGVEMLFSVFVDVLMAYTLDRLLKGCKNVALVYSFNPLSILAFVESTDRQLEMLFVAAGLMYSIEGMKRGIVFLVMACLMNTLMIPITLIVLLQRKRSSISCTVSLSIFLLLCSIFRDMYVDPNLSPNIGLFWYTLTLLFKEQRHIFPFLLKLPPFLICPLLVSQITDPFLLYFSSLVFSFTFDPHPSISKLNILFILYLYKVVPLYSKDYYIHPLIPIALLISVLLGLMMTFIYTRTNSGNANFVYFQLIVFHFLLQFLMLDAVSLFKQITFQKDTSRTPAIPFSLLSPELPLPAFDGTPSASLSLSHQTSQAFSKPTALHSSHSQLQQ